VNPTRSRAKRSGSS